MRNRRSESEDRKMIKYRKAVVCPCCDEYVTQEGYTEDFTADEMIVCLNDFSQEIFTRR